MAEIERPGVPDAALDADISILGRKGAGKSYAARGMVERLMDAGRRVVVLDPMGSWWGLKANADGSPGFPVTVVGGEHADIGADPAKGAALGAFIARSRGCFVIDTSELRRPQTVAFVGALLAALYAINRDPLWLVVEEADFYAPQGATREQALLGAELDQIARRGRARGFRLWTVTQRPAKLDKSLLSQASSLLVMKLIAPHDRRAVEDWLSGNIDDPGAVADSLPQLVRGQGFFWNPDLDIAKRLFIPPARTLDTSFTPSADAAPIKATLARVDVAALRAALGSDLLEPTPEAIRAEAYARGRADGAREERDRLRVILGSALAALGEPQEPRQEPQAAAPATQVADTPPEAAPAPPVARDDGPKTNDEAQRKILARLNRPQRRILERILEDGSLRRDDLQKRAGMERASAAFVDNLAALERMDLLMRQGSTIKPSAKLYPLGADHR